MADLKENCPSIYTHYRCIKENTKLIKEMQCRMNPNMNEAVKKEIIKWLDVEVIYPIFDNQWVWLNRLNLALIEKQTKILISEV